MTGADVRVGNYRYLLNQQTLGIKELCITSDGKKYENPKIIRKYEKKLVKLQRQFTRIKDVSI